MKIGLYTSLPASSLCHGGGAVDKEAIWRLSALANARSISLLEFVKSLRKAKVLQVCVDLLRMEMSFNSRRFSMTTKISQILLDVPIQDYPDLGAALRALERSRLDRICFAEFVIRVARSGFVWFTIFLQRNYISFEECNGHGFSVPVTIKPPRRAKIGRPKKDAGPR